LRTPDLPEPRVSDVNSEGAARAPGSLGARQPTSARTGCRSQSAETDLIPRYRIRLSDAEAAVRVPRAQTGPPESFPLVSGRDSAGDRDSCVRWGRSGTASACGQRPEPL